MGPHSMVTEPSFLSPFLNPGPTATKDSLAILHLSRENLIPAHLNDQSAESTGYSEGQVINTRFGSFPHSTLINTPWGTQVLASKVDTGSRGRPGKNNAKKRRHDDFARDGDGGEEEASELKWQKAAVTAASGFCHLLPPTPEAWTVSLPHRTQIVYTPDYSFIVQKLRIRPGSVVIESGAGSGSFTHAAARAAYEGRATCADFDDPDQVPRRSRGRRTGGRVYSYEYHQPRAERLRSEIQSHGLDDIVQVTHQDVCQEGFTIPTSPPSPTEPSPSQETSLIFPRVSPKATSVFLDLPAPWQALPHLTRHPQPQPSNTNTDPQPAASPLDPTSPIHLCAFLPCIEQVTRMISSLRAHAWTEVTMHELLHRRLDVRRERTGLDLEGLRGVTAVASTPEESCKRLEEVERRGREFREESVRVMRERVKQTGELDADREGARDVDLADAAEAKGLKGVGPKGKLLPGDRDRESKRERLARITKEERARKSFREGRLVCRTEPELRNHTSYLVFATLPREWSDEDERRARERWPVGR